MEAFMSKNHILFSVLVLSSLAAYGADNQSNKHNQSQQKEKIETPFKKLKVNFKKLKVSKLGKFKKTDGLNRYNIRQMYINNDDAQPLSWNPDTVTLIEKKHAETLKAIAMQQHVKRLNLLGRRNTEELRQVKLENIKNLEL